jgi:Lysozyme like domain
MAELSPLEILTLALGAGFSPDGEEAITATAIALAESSGNPNAHNDVPPDDSFGLWQINMLGALGPDRREKLGLSRNEELFDPPTNARAARFVFNEAGQKFRPWSTFTNGAFKDHLSAARDAAAHVAPGVVEVDMTPAQEAKLDKILSVLTVTGSTGPEQTIELLFSRVRDVNNHVNQLTEDMKKVKAKLQIT